MREGLVNCHINLENQAKGLCIQCGQDAMNKCRTEEGRREFHISGYCEECFDALFEDEDA